MTFHQCQQEDEEWLQVSYDVRCCLSAVNGRAAIYQHHRQPNEAFGLYYAHIFVLHLGDSKALLATTVFLAVLICQLRINLWNGMHNSLALMPLDSSCTPGTLLMLYL